MVNLEDEVLVSSSSNISTTSNGNVSTMERKNAVAQLKSSRSPTDKNGVGGRANTTNKAQTLKELQQNGLINGNGIMLKDKADKKRDDDNGRIMLTENGLNHHILGGGENDSLEEVSSTAVDVVVSRDDHQDDHCLLCNSPFNLLLHKRFICKVCALNVCRNCSLFDDPDWICTVCDQQRAISSQLNCQSWLCKRIRSPGDRELVHLVNAKLRLEAELRGGANNSMRLLNGNSTSNGSSANGHHHLNSHHSTTTEVLIHREAPFLELGPNQLEHLIALRSDVELIVVKLLGTESIDYAHVGLLFDDGQYSDTVQTYTEPLASLLSILQESIYATQSSSTREPPPLPPTEAYAKLKDLLGDISEKAFHLTPLRPILRLQLEEWLQTDCASYEHLLANAIVNQIVEVSQSRFLTASSSSALTLKSANSFVASCSSVSGHYSPISTTTATSFGRVRSSCSGGSLYGSNSNESAGTESDISPPPKLSAGEVDPYGSYDSYHRGANGYHRNGSSAGPNMSTCEEASNFDDVDEVEFEEVEDEEDLVDDEEEDDVQSNDSFDINLDFEPIRVHFPEAGVDLVDSRKFPSVESDLSQDSGIKLIDNSSSWQDNWLFKKHKENKSYHQYHLNSDLHYGYMALALSDPVPMLIPNPSQPYVALIGEAEVDAVSDLEEHACPEDVEEVSFEDLFSDLDEEDSEEETGSDGAEADAKTSPTSASKLMSSVRLSAQQPQALPRRPISVNLSKEALAALAANAKWKRWAKIKVPDYVPIELRSSICSSIPNSHQTNLEYVPCITLKPASTATSGLHSGITAQFVVRASGLLPLYFAWYKDSALIACSDEATAASSAVTLEENEETKQRQLARVYFGVRFTHRRSVEPQASGTLPYRLIVFNESECILEVRKTAVSHSGSYSVVAYNHAGYDWADFTVAVDRTHYSSCNAPAVLSPRPVRRRPQNKPKKSLVCTVIEQQQLSIINHLAKAVSKTQGAATPAPTLLDLPPVPRPRSITPTTTASTEQKQHFGTVQTPEPIANFKQRTWKEREEEQNSVELPNESRRKISNGQLYDSTDGRLSRTNSAASASPTLAEVEEIKPELPLEPSPDENEIESEPVMEIAEREHKKWLRPDVELVNNPYTAESIEARAKHLQELSSLEEAEQKVAKNGGEKGELEEEEDEDEATRFEKKKFFSDRDITRYKRDYYLPKNRPTSEDRQVFSILNTLGGQTNGGQQQKSTKPTTLSLLKDSIPTPQLINSPSVTESANDDHQNDHIEELERVEEAVHPQIDITNTTTLTATISTPSPQPLSFSDSSSVASLEEKESPLDSSELQSPPPLPSSPPPPMSTTTVLTTPLVNGTAQHSTVILNGVNNHHPNHSPSITPTPTETTVLSISKPLIVGTEIKAPHAQPHSTSSLTNGNVRSSSFSPSSSSLDSYSDLPKSRPLKDQVLAKLPSVKNLVSLFSKDKEQPSLPSSSPSPVTSLSPSPNHYLKGANYSNGRVASSGASSLLVPPSQATRNANNYKIHSLTARSIPREFREQNAKNIPHTTNRIRLTNELMGTPTGNRILEQNESDQSAGNSAAESSLTSEDLNFSLGNSSLQSTGAANGTASDGHLGDQTPEPTNGPVEMNGERTSADSGRYRPILQRASYWEKHMEEGLVSDQKVKEPFPTVEGQAAKEQQQQQSDVPKVAAEPVGQ